MAKKYSEVRKALRRAGCTIERVTGSHEIWSHADGRSVSVAAGEKDNRDVPADGSWHARAADLPVFSCADSRQEVEREIRAGIAGYLEFIVQEGQAGPPQMAHDAGIVSLDVPSAVTP
ncbi:MAG TPA: type II toxin-antitoxin system HicA family toxin [Solirubrobacteraceae bacterium]|jgi:predicted RNase H-like HicB family nuclease|nr:type II toxin-antitoxin system HicA family toxin [Solirubrobacteraceae bacterium]